MAGRQGQYPPELRERAVRLVAECRSDHASEWEAMRSVAAKLGIGTTELIKPRGPWRTVEQVEIATLEWVDWFNHRRLFEACGDIPPAELEQAHYRRRTSLTEAGQSTT
jgi:transposase InsO family protein